MLSFQFSSLLSEGLQVKPKEWYGEECGSSVPKDWPLPCPAELHHPAIYTVFGVALRGSCTKRLYTSRPLRGPEKTVPQPLGESRASWSKVRILPPALRMRLWARPLTRRARKLQFGHLLDTNIIGYSPHDHSCFALPARKLHLPDLGWAQGKGAVIYTLNKFPPALKSTPPIQASQGPTVVPHLG